MRGCGGLGGNNMQDLASASFLLVLSQIVQFSRLSLTHMRMLFKLSSHLTPHTQSAKKETMHRESNRGKDGKKRV